MSYLLFAILCAHSKPLPCGKATQFSGKGAVDSKRAVGRQIAVDLLLKRNSMSMKMPLVYRILAMDHGNVIKPNKNQQYSNLHFG